MHTNLFLRYLGRIDKYDGFYTVSIDGFEEERLDGKNDGRQLTQQMHWSKTYLNPGKHILQDDPTGPYMNLDFLRSVTNEAMG